MSADFRRKSGQTSPKLARCAKRESLVPAEFLKALNEPTSYTGTLPEKMAPADALRVMQKAFSEYAQGKRTAEALASLRKALAPLLAQESKQASELAGLQKIVDDTAGNLAVLDSKIETLERQNTQAGADLKALQSAKTMADDDLRLKAGPYQNGLAILDPLWREARAREDIYDSARDAVNETNSEIRRQNSLLGDLQDEVIDLRPRISALRQNLPSAQAAVARARGELNGFNEQLFIDNYLRDDSSYRSLHQQAR